MLRRIKILVWKIYRSKDEVYLDLPAEEAGDKAYIVGRYQDKKGLREGTDCLLVDVCVVNLPHEMPKKVSGPWIFYVERKAKHFRLYRGPDEVFSLESI